MSVVFACKLIHLEDDLFRASQFDHRLSEGLVADVSVVDAVILLNCFLHVTTAAGVSHDNRGHVKGCPFWPKPFLDQIAFWSFPVGAPKGGFPKGEAPKGGRPKISHFFCGFLMEFWWCY